MSDDKTDRLCSHENTSFDEQMWRELYTWIFPLTEMWVRYSHVPTWNCQCKEIAEEISQEAILRTFKQYKQAIDGTVPPIVSLKALCRTIAQNYLRDRRRKEWRLIRPTSNYVTYDAFLTTDPEQDALDRLVLHSTLTAIALAVVSFPHGQKLALLTAIANISDFDEQPNTLEQALSDVGIQLRDYKQLLPTSPLERSRYSALLCVARKRLKNIIQL